MQNEQQQPTLARLPLHPTVAALGLPPGPWVHEAGQGSRSREIWDANDTEVVWVTGSPERKVGDEFAPMREVAMTETIANVVATAPEGLNVLAHILDWFDSNPPYDLNHDAISGLIAEARAVLARAQGQEGGQDA